MDQKVYLDYNATTPLAPEVKQAMIEAMELWQNPSSSYSDLEKNVMKDARKSVSEMIHADGDPSEEIIFTSGGTEGNNWIIYSIVRWFKSTAVGTSLPHIITTNIEHDSITNPLKQLVSDKIAKVTFLPVQSTGAFKPIDIMLNITTETVLITVMTANNETGVIQNIEEVGSRLELINVERMRLGLNRIFLHTDAAQAIGKLHVDVNHLKVDYMTIVGHKFYGPKGSGVLFRRTGCPLIPLLLGGGQEFGFRSGTEDIVTISGLSAACKLVTHNLQHYIDRFEFIRDLLEEELTEKFNLNFNKLCISNVKFNFKQSNRLPNTSSVVFKFCDPKYDLDSGQKMLQLLDRIQASVGSACHAGSTRVSPVLLSSGLDPEAAKRTIRLSLGRETSPVMITETVSYIYHKLKQRILQDFDTDGHNKDNELTTQCNSMMLN